MYTLLLNSPQLSLLRISIMKPERKKNHLKVQIKLKRNTVAKLRNALKKKVWSFRLPSWKGHCYRFSKSDKDGEYSQQLS